MGRVSWRPHRSVWIMSIAGELNAPTIGHAFLVTSRHPNCLDSQLLGQPRGQTFDQPSEGPSSFNLDLIGAFHSEVSATTVPATKNCHVSWLTSHSCSWRRQREPSSPIASIARSTTCATTGPSSWRPSAHQGDPPDSRGGVAAPRRAPRTQGPAAPARDGIERTLAEDNLAENR
jgi:hypothetical protein